jgi:hypothetical protein
MGRSATQFEKETPTIVQNWKVYSKSRKDKSVEEWLITSWKMFKFNYSKMKFLLSSRCNC